MSFSISTLVLLSNYNVLYHIQNYKQANRGTIYIGQHITSDIQDGYLGSGVRITNSVAKYGKEQFTKEILFVYDNFEEMDSKERELVDEAFITRKDTLNITLGGTGWCTGNTVVVQDLTNPGTYTRIHVTQFDSKIHKYLTSGTVQVYLKNTGMKKRVSVQEYWDNKHLYDAVSTGRVSVEHIVTKITSSIPVADFDPQIYKKVLGGIVCIKDGIRQYVTKEEFISNHLAGIHVGKVTALDTITGIRQHISTEEYAANKSRYLANGSGTVTVKDIQTGKRTRIPKSDVNPDVHIIGTSGWTTVYDIQQNKFINIPKGTADVTKHKKANDKKFVCFFPDGTERFTFWGGKQEFLKLYKCAASVWEAAIKGQRFQSNTRRSASFNNCTFNVLDWKPSKKN